MPDLSFSVRSVRAVDGSMTPLLDFELVVEDANGGEAANGAEIDTVALSCQIMIEAVQRPYTVREKEALLDLFGVPERWGTTLKTLLWTHASMVIPRFTGATTVRLRVPSSFDLGIASTKYFFALEDGDVPLNFQFSGTVFYRDADAALMTQRISWTKEARFRLPVSVWRDLMGRHYSEGAWICLDRDSFDRLYRYKARRALTSWEAVIDELLESSTVEVAP